MCADAGACDGPNSSSPPARRVYRGIEVIARKTLGKELWAQASYVYSSLRGNYDGAINEGSLGTVPGRNTDFDFPALWHNAYGRLFLDRPHRLRLDGYWTSPWRVSIGLQAFVESGAPESRLLVFQVYQSPLLYQSPRGSVGRMAAQWEANLTVGYPIAVRGATLVLQGYVYNLFNNQIPLTRSDDATLGSDYGKFTSRQAPRSFRAAAKVSF